MTLFDVLIGGVVLFLVVLGLIELFNVVDSLQQVTHQSHRVENAVDTRRRTFVKVQQPVMGVVDLQVGGVMKVTGRRVESVIEYDESPDKALYRASKQYKTHEITHYVEQHPDADIRHPEEEISDSAWVETVAKPP